MMVLCVATVVIYGSTTIAADCARVDEFTEQQLYMNLPRVQNAVTYLQFCKKKLTLVLK